jgi:hypothetical protein
MQDGQSTAALPGPLACHHLDQAALRLYLTLAGPYHHDDVVRGHCSAAAFGPGAAGTVGAAF